MIKILHLEDNRRDAELVRAQVEQQWPGSVVTLVDNRAAFEAEMHHDFDLVLSDHQLPDFDGLDALRLVRKQHPDLPFILLSGTIGEERAIEALRAGANEFLTKDRPQRLVAAMERALTDARHARERRVAAEQMLRLQRLENIGTLAAGVAHEFNNLLGSIMMGVTLTRTRVATEADQRILTTMEKSAARGAALVKQIQGFCRGAAGERHLLQPRHLVHQVGELLRRALPKDILLREEISPHLWPIHANATQLHQVVLNLGVNARDAMPEGGLLTLRLSNRPLDAVSAAALPGAREGNFLLLEVADTGAGIPADVLPHIWEPFFTTKSAGSGLGLTTVRNIVEAHQGFVSLATAVGRGTTVQAWWPADGEGDMDHDLGQPLAAARGHGELVLVAEGDGHLRELTRSVLVAQGYRVVVAADGPEAVAMLAPRAHEFRLVVCDIGLAGLDGAALVRVLHSLNPATRVILVGGAATGAVDARHGTAGGAVLLAKPYTAAGLLAVVHQLLAPENPVAAAARPGA